MFILYVLVLFIASNGLGKLILKEDNKLYPLRSLIGFTILLSILQIGYYPLEQRFLSSNIAMIYTSIIICISFIIGLIKIDKSDFSFLKHYEFYVIIILIFIIIKVLPYNEAGDDVFYMPFIKDNAYINNLNTMNPRTGEIGKVSNIYWYQGYYLLNSFIYRIQNTLFNNSANILISFRTTMSLLFSIFASYILTYIRKTNKNKINKYVFLLIQILSILLVGSQEWSHIYWGSFVLFTVFIPLFLLEFNEYLRDKSLTNKVLLLFSCLASISLASSALYLYGIIIFGFLLYESLIKKAKIEDYYFIVLPLMHYATLILNLKKAFWIIILGFIIIYFLKKYINKIYNKIGFYLLLTVPLTFICVNLFYLKNFNWDLYRLGYAILFFNIVISIYLIYIFIRKKQIDPLLFVFVTTVLVFFNPLTSATISKYLTTTSVYYRIFYITKNPLIISLIFITIYNYIKDKKAFRIIFISLISLLIINYSKNLVKFTLLAPSYCQRYNYLYRETYDNIELEKYLYELKEGKILSIYFAPRIANTKLKSFVYRYPNDTKLKDDFWLNVLYYDNNNVVEFIKEIKQNQFNYIIIYNNENIKNKFDLKIIFENDTYVMYEV